MTGAPFASATTASWLKGAFSASQTADSSIFWSGGNEWYFAQVGYDPTAQMLDGVNNIRRFFPYSLIGVGRARGGTANSSTYCGILGQTKYIRELDASYSFKARLKSKTPGSNQIWRASVFDTNSQPQVVLWGPEVEVP